MAPARYLTPRRFTLKIDAPCRKRAKVSPESCDGKGPDFFDALPDDIVVSILAKLTSSASCPADFINALITCKRFNGLALNSVVLSKASPKIFAIKAQNWCESAHKFLKLCSDSGNVEASYCLGMVIYGKWRLVRRVLLLRMQMVNHLLLDVLGKHRDKYHELLLSDCRKQITDALSSDTFEQILMKEEYEYSMNVVAFSLQVDSP